RARAGPLRDWPDAEPGTHPHEGRRARVEDGSRDPRKDDARRDAAAGYLRPRPQGTRRVQAAQAGRRRTVKRALVLFEDAVAATALAAMVVLPVLEIALRRTAVIGIPGAGPIVQHLVLWVGFLGGAIAAREGRLLALATGAFVPEGA